MQAKSQARHRNTPLDGEIRAHIDDARAALHTLIATQGHRFYGLSRLDAQLNAAVSSYRRHGRREVRGVIERVNELCVVRCLLADPAFARAELAYEPDLLANGPRFDIIATVPDGEIHAVEIKTISPQAANTGTETWIPPPPHRRALRPHPSEIVGAAEAAFQRHAVVTAQKAIRFKAAGHATVARLIICGDGAAWGVADAKTFASRVVFKPLTYGVMLRRSPDLEPLIWVSALPSSATG